MPLSAEFLAPMLAAAEAGGVPSPVDHIVVHPFLNVGGWWIWSSATANLLISGVLMLLLGMFVAKRIRTGPSTQGEQAYLTKGKFASMVEVLIVALRDQFIRPVLGERADRFLPFLLCVFFFILINNLLGMIPLLDINMLINFYAVESGLASGPKWKDLHIAPFGGTATQSIWVTGGLALVAGLVINIAGVMRLGVGEYAKHLTAGTPVYLWPIMVPVEIMGTLIKPIALALRLFAVMTAGHILLAVMFVFVELIARATSLGIIVAIPLWIPVLFMAVFIFVLEVFVSFLQALIFMFLTAVFISLLDHHGDHAHEHDTHVPSAAQPA
ncbi:MAG: F0F1 ATP synthase subunit A [Planctomycetota bacterium]